MRDIENRTEIIRAARRRARKVDDVLQIIEVGKQVGRTDLQIAERVVKHLERHYP